MTTCHKYITTTVMIVLQPSSPRDIEVGIGGDWSILATNQTMKEWQIDIPTSPASSAGEQNGDVVLLGPCEHTGA